MGQAQAIVGRAKCHRAPFTPHYTQSHPERGDILRTVCAGAFVCKHCNRSLVRKSQCVRVNRSKRIFWSKSCRLNLVFFGELYPVMPGMAKNVMERKLNKIMINLKIHFSTKSKIERRRREKKRGAEVEKYGIGWMRVIYQKLLLAQIVAPQKSSITHFSFAITFTFIDWISPAYAVCARSRTHICRDVAAL